MVFPFAIPIIVHNEINYFLHSKKMTFCGRIYYMHVLLSISIILLTSFPYVYAYTIIDWQPYIHTDILRLMRLKLLESILMLIITAINSFRIFQIFSVGIVFGLFPRYFQTKDSSVNLRLLYYYMCTFYKMQWFTFIIYLPLERLLCLSHSTAIQTVW